MRILVVDDNRDVATMLAELLQIDGHEDVAIAHDGAAALASMRASKPDFVLCDLVLPGELDGRAIARTCRSEPQFHDVRAGGDVGLWRSRGPGPRDRGGVRRPAGEAGSIRDAGGMHPAGGKRVAVVRVEAVAPLQRRRQPFLVGVRGFEPPASTSRT